MRTPAVDMSPSWPGPAHAEAPVLDIGADQLWRAWLDFASRQPRLALRAQDEHEWRSLHVQRSAVLRFPDLVRAEVVPLGSQRSSLILDSRFRFGWWDLGINRRRSDAVVDDLRQITSMAIDKAQSIRPRVPGTQTGRPASPYQGAPRGRQGQLAMASAPLSGRAGVSIHAPAQGRPATAP